ncbi:unnamed protein product [Boreogadus saida]
MTDLWSPLAAHTHAVHTQRRRQLSLDLYCTEDEIYELSYTKEPRNPKIQPVASVKPPVVAEWGSGVNPRLDPDTISKHVKQMVDSIMKNYDHNLDGYISLEDFEKISANFPFSFCTHETDRHGQISREEITSYFMRGMSVCAKLGFNFNDVHNFQETTYKQTTFCKGCGGCLLGVKQGFHCKDCGMNCHKHCRALVGMECLRKHKMAASSCLCTTPDARSRGNNSCGSEEVAFVFPPTGDTEPMRKGSDPMRKGSDPTRKGSDPTRKSSDPTRKSSDPTRKSSDPTRKSSDPMRKGSDPTRKSSSPLRKGSGLLRKGSDPMALFNRSTQTEPGTWTPERGNKRIERNHAQEKLQSNSLPPRTRECSVPVSFLQEKMEELHLYKERNREPD